MQSFRQIKSARPIGSWGDHFFVFVRSWLDLSYGIHKPVSPQPEKFTDNIQNMSDLNHVQQKGKWRKNSQHGTKIPDLNAIK